jgi:hypothetical protein
VGFDDASGSYTVSPHELEAIRAVLRGGVLVRIQEEVETRFGVSSLHLTSPLPLIFIRGNEVNTTGGNQCCGTASCVCGFGSVAARYFASKK